MCTGLPVAPGINFFALHAALRRRVTSCARSSRLFDVRRLAELRKQFPKAEILTDAGESPVDAAAMAKRADVAVVFAWKAESEGHDNADLSLPWGQRQIIGTLTSRAYRVGLGKSAGDLLLTADTQISSQLFGR